MNFLEAVEVAREKSVKIRRPHWITPSYLKYDESGGYIVNEADVNPALKAGDYLADDWQVKMVKVRVDSIPPGKAFTYSNQRMVPLKGTVYGADYIPIYHEKDWKFGYISPDTKVEVEDV